MRGMQLLLLLCMAMLLSFARGADRDSAFPGYKEEGVAACRDRLPEALCIDYKATQMCNTGAHCKTKCRLRWLPQQQQTSTS